MIKYPSIENHYQNKFIQRFVDLYPEIWEETVFTLDEKIHGSNIQLGFSPGKETYEVCSRNRILEPGENFYDIWSILEQPKYSQICSDMQKIVMNTGVPHTLHGELFGPGVMKGIDYGNEKNILFFDLRIGEYIVSQKEFEDFVKVNLKYTLDLFKVPHICKIKGLKRAIQFNVKINSRVKYNLHQITDEENVENIIEGVVIKPWEKVYISPVGEILYLKLKNEKFKEKEKKDKKPIKEKDPTLVLLHQEFLDYITDQRLENLFSKEGEISDSKEIGKYIKLMLQDAKEDFEKDFEEKLENIDKKDLKFIFNAGGAIKSMLDKYL